MSSDLKAAEEQGRDAMQTHHMRSAYQCALFTRLWCLAHGRL